MKDKLLITIFFVVIFPIAIAQNEQSHPLSQIKPIDTNLNMFGFNITNVTFIGINLTNPQYALDVVGDVRWSGTLIGGIIPWNLINGYNLNVNWTGLLGWGNLTDYNLNVPWTGLLGWRNLTGYDLNVAWTGKLGWGNLTGYNLNVNWIGKLGWGNLTGYPSIIAGPGLTGGGDLSTSISLSIAFGEDFLGWRNLTAYPSPCPDGHAVQAIGDTLTCIQINATQGVINGSGSAGQVAFFTASNTISGSNNLYWDNTNARLGIGTNNPQAKLHIEYLPGNQGTIAIFGSTSRIRIIDEGSGLPSGIAAIGPAYGLGLYADVGPIRFFTGGTTSGHERMRIDAAGNVGIGTTSPAGKLHVAGTIFISPATYVPANIPPIHTDTSDTALFVPTTTDGALDLRLYIDDDWNDRFSIWGNSCGGGGCQNLAYSSKIAEFRSDGQIYLKGNVGIGTTAPTSKLSVGGNPSAAALIGVKDYVGSGLNNLISLEDAYGNNRLVVTTAGNVGIGTTNPLNKLEVVGTTNITSAGTMFYVDANGNVWVKL